MTLRQEAATTAQTVLQNPKVAWGVTGTTGILATLADWINGIFIGVGTNAASIAGLLSIVLMFNNLYGGYIKRKNEKIEYEILQKRLESMQSGKHSRRSTDRDDSNAVDGG